MLAVYSAATANNRTEGSAMTVFRTALVSLSVLWASGASIAQDVTGAGASFPAPIYAKWADAYNKASGARINYQSVGSGAGLRQIRG